MIKSKLRKTRSKELIWVKEIMNRFPQKVADYRAGKNKKEILEFLKNCVHIYIIKTDNAGNQQWSKTISGAQSEYANSIIQSTDGKYVIAGVTSSSTFSSGAIYIVKIDTNGNILWDKVYGESASISYGCQSIKQTNDGGYILDGSGGNGMDACLFKLDSIGNLTWAKAYGGTDLDYCFSARQTTDNGYILTGYARSFGAGSDELYLVKTTSDGNLLWSKSFGGSNEDVGLSVELTYDNGYIVTGYTGSFGFGIHDILLLKTDSNGNSGCFQSNQNSNLTSSATVVSILNPQTAIGGLIGTPFSTTNNNVFTVTPLCSTSAINENHPLENHIPIRT